MNFAHMDVVLAILYILTLIGIMGYCFMQLWLAIIYLVGKLKKGKKIPSNDQMPMGNWPMVTVQLPVYNEFYVVERLIDAVTALDYPKDKLEIQLLDDSTDDSFGIGTEKVAKYKIKGYQIEQIKRPDRAGYKAGALQYGLELAKGDFIAIFDADFIPDRLFLKKTIPLFENERVGLVQTRWQHLNRNYSLLTRLQAFGLDMHFTVEQDGRNTRGYFINFNGTGGIWRKKAIETSGGWQADTLTEDLDLSYRAQLNGWKFEYMEEVLSPSELPVEMKAIKGQQFRWNKGGAEVARKLLGSIYRSKIPFLNKLHATSHLLSSSIFVLIFCSALLSVPVLYFQQTTLPGGFFALSWIFYFSVIAIYIAYAISVYYNRQLKGNWMANYLLYFPLFLSVTLGLSWHNTMAVVRGLAGQKTPFIRTPKFNIISKGAWKNNRYLNKKLPLETFMEGLLLLYFTMGVVMSLHYSNLGMAAFHFTAAFGFGFIFFMTLKHVWSSAAYTQ